MNILLVEDDQWLGECYVDWLVKAGFTPHWARTAQEALDALDEQMFAVMVLDLFLPKANGIQLLGMLAAHAQKVPVIVCSGALPTDVDWQAYGVRTALSKTDLTPKLFISAVKAVI